jgi:hypothetical protein
VDQTFVDELMSSLKSLRAYAISLTRDIHQAEDPVQETVLKAIGKQETFEAGTNLQAWLFTILRNLFFSSRRTKQREVEDADGVHAATMITIPDQEDRLAVRDRGLADMSRDLDDVIEVLLQGRVENAVAAKCRQALGFIPGGSCRVGYLLIHCRVVGHRARLGKTRIPGQTAVTGLIGAKGYSGSPNVAEGRLCNAGREATRLAIAACSLRPM